MAITREQIWAAADAIDAAGQNPTLALVRKTVGGGSFTTIQDAMTEWKARRATKGASASEPMPQAFADRITGFGAEIWAIAIEMATARLGAEREALEAARADTEIARIEAAELADQLTAELDEAKARIVEFERAEVVTRSEIDELRQRLAAADARAVEIERQATELRRENEAAREVAIEARERLAAQSGKLEASEKQVAELLTLLSRKEEV